MQNPSGEYRFLVKDMDEEQAAQFWAWLKNIQKSDTTEGALLYEVAQAVLIDVEGQDLTAEECNTAEYLSPLFINVVMEQVGADKATFDTGQQVLDDIAAHTAAQEEQPQLVSPLPPDEVQQLTQVLSLNKNVGKGLSGITSGDYKNLEQLIKTYDQANAGVEIDVTVSDGNLELISSPGNTPQDQQGYLKIAVKMVMALCNLCKAVNALYNQNTGTKKALVNSDFLAALQKAATNPCNNQVAQELQACLAKIPKG